MLVTLVTPAYKLQKTGLKNYPQKISWSHWSHQLLHFIFFFSEFLPENILVTLVTLATTLQKTVLRILPLKYLGHIGHTSFYASEYSLWESFPANMLVTWVTPAYKLQKTGLKNYPQKISWSHWSHQILHFIILFSEFLP
jgi:hypothetical protein